MQVTTTPISIGKNVGILFNDGPDDILVSTTVFDPDKAVTVQHGHQLGVGYSNGDVWVKSLGTSEIRNIAGGFPIESSGSSTSDVTIDSDGNLTWEV